MGSHKFKMEPSDSRDSSSWITFIAMKATKNLPDNYRQIGVFDLSKNKFLAISLNVASAIIFTVFGIAILRLVLLLRHEDYSQQEIIVPLNFQILLGILIVTILAVIIHEIIHGLLFWYYTGEKAKFGFKGFYAYAAAPEWYIPRQQHIVIGLGPLILITITGFPLVLMAPISLFPYLFLFVLFNLAGSIGDIVTVVWLLTKPHLTYVNDYGDGISVYVSDDKES